MTFPRLSDITIDEVNDFDVFFHVPDPTDTEDSQIGRVEARFQLSNGATLNQAYNLIARLNDDAEGQAHLANLVALRDYIRTRLENEALPL